MADPGRLPIVSVSPHHTHAQSPVHTGILFSGQRTAPCPPGGLRAVCRAIFPPYAIRRTGPTGPFCLGRMPTRRPEGCHDTTSAMLIEPRIGSFLRQARSSETVAQALLFKAVQRAEFCFVMIRSQEKPIVMPLKGVAGPFIPNANEFRHRQFRIAAQLGCSGKFDEGHRSFAASEAPGAWNPTAASGSDAGAHGWPGSK